MTALLEALVIGLRFISACKVEQNLQAVTIKAIISKFFKTTSFQCGAGDLK